VRDFERGLVEVLHRSVDGHWLLNGEDARDSVMTGREKTLVYATRGALYALKHHKHTTQISGRHAGQVQSARIGRVRVVGGSAWGADSSDWVEIFQGVTESREVLCQADMEWKATAASVALDSMKYAPKSERSQLPPRWRQLSHAAIHPGPMVVTRGGSDNAVAMDRESAYLHAMNGPLPVRGTYYCVKGFDWRDIRMADWGVVRAMVEVPPWVGGDLGALPVRKWCNVGGGCVELRTVYPWGVHHGAWTIPMLRWAESIGVNVMRITDGFGCETEPWGRRIVDSWGRLPKRTRKLLYTGAWGRMACAGWASARKVDGVWLWKGGAKNPLGHIAPGYRPDVSACICGRNALEMAQKIEALGPGRLVAAHVDCIWGDAADMDSLGWEGWKEKDRGPLRFFGVGTYEHVDTWGSQALSTERHALDRAMGVVAESRPIPEDCREWAGDPRVSMDASSVPTESPCREMAPEMSEPGEHWYSTTDGCWTQSGWLKKDRYPEREEYWDE